MNHKKKIGDPFIDEKTPRRISDISLENLYLYDRMEKGKATTHELVRLSYLRDMFTVEDVVFLEENPHMVSKHCEGCIQLDFYCLFGISKTA